MGENILVMGVGRSGTTAVYCLLQEILEDHYPDDIDYVYEPFLWDRKRFNKPYDVIKRDFRNLSSVSLEGLYHNKQIPLLLNDCNTVPPASMSWLKETLTAKNDKSHYLGKMIRANGRLPVIREVAPETKIVFIIRNPLDVLNSSLQLFSFYGDGFHSSDYPRFLDDISTFFHESLTISSGNLAKIEAEYRYWFYSNLAFLQFAETHPENILCLAYESFVAQRCRVTKSICEFLNIEFNDNYTEVSKIGVGAINQKFSSLTGEEHDFLLEKLNEYKKMLCGISLSPTAELEELVKYRDRNPASGKRIHSSNYFNSMYANSELNRKIQELDERNRELDKRNQELEVVNEKFDKLFNNYRKLHEIYSALITSKRVRMVNSLLAPIDMFRRRKQSEKPGRLM